MADEQGFHVGSAFVTLEPDDEGFAEKVRAAVEEALAGLSATVKIGADDEELKAKADEAGERIDRLDGKTATAILKADDADLSEKADSADERMDLLDGKTATATLDLDDEDFNAKKDAADERLKDNDETTATPKLDLDKEDFDAKKDDADARLDENDARKASPKLGLDDGDFKARMAEDESSFSAFGALSEHPLISAIAGGLTSILPGLGGASVGLGALAGTGALAFGGIFKAVDAAHQASQATGQTSAQLAATEFQNATQVQQAQQAIGQAHRQAAEDAVTSAQAIESAESNLASTERNASASQVQAVQAVGQAQQQLQQANFGLAAAQYGLSEAWIQARYNLEQLNDAEKNSATTIAAAKLAVAQAQYQQQQTDQNAFSTSLDRQQAAIAVAQAEEALTSAQQQATETAAEAHLEDKKGVAGSQTVLSAQEALTEAINGQKNAQQALADAQQNLRNTELNDAEQVQQAQLAVTQAEQQAAYQQQSDALAVKQAQQNLTDTLKEQQLQQAATASTANQAASQFAKDMAGLSPAGRSFVDELLSMRGALKGLETDAQTGIMPGMLTFLRGIHSLLPVISAGVTSMAGSISRAFAGFGREMQTPGFKEVFRGLLQQGGQFVSQVLPAFGTFVRELAIIGSKQGAVSGLAGILSGLGLGLANVARGIEPFERSVGSVLTTVGKALEPVGLLLGRVVGSIGSALAPALRAMLPGFTKFVDLLGSSLASALTALAPDLDVFGQTMGGILIQLSPLLPVLAGLAGSMAQALLPALHDLLPPFVSFTGTLVTALVPVLQALTPVMGIFGQLLASQAQNFALTVRAGAPLLPVIGSLTALLIKIATPVLQLTAWISELATGAMTLLFDGIGYVVHAFASWIDLIPGWGTIFKGFGDGIDFVWSGIASGADTMRTGVETALSGIQDAALFMWHDVFDPVYDGILSGGRSFVSGMGTVWGGLESVFRAPVNFLISTVYDKGIAALWNDVVTHIGLSSIKLPIIPGLAAGGMVPGKDRGRDEVLIAARPEEGVLVPGAVRSLGGPAAIHALNAAHGGGRGGDGRHFSVGGVVGDIGGFFGGIGHDITSFIGGAIDVGKMIAAIASGNTTAFTNAASSVIGTHAAGDLGKIMTGIPHAIVSDLAKELVGSVTGPSGPLPGGGTGAVGALPANWKTIASFLAGRGFTKFAAAGVAGNIDAESGGDPEILEIGGGGGGGLIQWTPYPPGYITGDYQADLMTQLNAILSWGGGPGLVNRATSPSNAAQLYQDYYERPASLTASLPVRMASANAVYKAMNWGSFDDGGWLPPSAALPSSMPMVPVNTTGRPEAVFDPDESQAIKDLARALVAMKRGGDGASAAPTVNMNYYGPQAPTPEMQAQQMRDLGMALSGP